MKVFKNKKTGQLTAVLSKKDFKFLQGKTPKTIDIKKIKFGF